MSPEDRSDQFKAKIIIGLPYGDKPVYWEAPVNPQPYLLPMLDRILAGEPDEFWGAAGQPASAEELLEYIVRNLSVAWQSIPVPQIDIKARHN